VAERDGHGEGGDQQPAQRIRHPHGAPLVHAVGDGPAEQPEDDPGQIAAGRDGGDEQRLVGQRDGQQGERGRTQRVTEAGQHGSAPQPSEAPAPCGRAHAPHPDRRHCSPLTVRPMHKP
jgi:hypothetical protein